MNTTFRVNPNREYRVGLEGPPLRPKDDFIGVDFSPENVIFDNLRHYRNTIDLINRGVILETCGMADDVRGLSEEAYINRLRTMIYDVEEAITLQQIIGGREKFNRVVAAAKVRLLRERLPEPGFDPTFYDPD